MVVPNVDIDVYLIRHGRSVGQDDASTYKTIGDNKIPLTSAGQKQSLQAARLLNSSPQAGQLTAIYNSECLRAEQTAEIIQTELNRSYFIPRRAEPRLNKQTFGLFDGMLKSEERKARYPKEFLRFERQVKDKGLYHAVPPKGESIAHVYDRSASLRDDIYARNPQGSILVTHGLVAFCFEAAVFGHSSDWILEHENSMPNASITRIFGNLRGGLVSERIFNDTGASITLRKQPHI